MNQSAIVKKFLPGLCLPVILMLFGRCTEEKAEPYGFQLQFITEEYKPLNYTEGGEVMGLAPDVLREICRSLNIPFKVKVMNWDDAYELAQTAPDAVLFSASMNSQRRELFKWAGPVASLEWNFYGLAQNRFNLNSLEQAKQVTSIGVLKDYTIEQYLVRQGFTNLVYCNNHEEALVKLLAGTLDLYPADRYTTEAALEKMGRSVYDLRAVLPVKTEMIYFAFNKTIPDEVVADFQRETDRLKISGVMKQLSQRYLGSSDYPGIIQIYTEEYPPLTFMGRYGEITGYGTDIVREIMKRNKVYEPIRISTWSNGYELALDNPNFCLFTMDRTEIRENLFRWVGPVGTNTTWFYVRTASGVKIGSLEDARELGSVGTVVSWFSDQHLRKLGFTNLVSGSDPVAMTTRLMKGEVDAFVCSGITFPDIIAEAGYSCQEVTPAFALMSSDFYISFSKNSSPELVSSWQSAFEAMQLDGTVRSVYDRWFSGF